MSKDVEIGCFVSPHGLGHATRLCAVLETLSSRVDGLQPHLFTTVSEPIFRESFHRYCYHTVHADVGLIQHDALHVDIDATIAELDRHFPYQKQLIDTLAQKCKNFPLILCDIAPLGIAVANQANIPSILIENFTWDWIYQPYIGLDSRMAPFSLYLEQLFKQATYHIQTQPVCRPVNADLCCGPIFRSIRRDREEIRNRLGCKSRKMVFISMGGVAIELPFLKTIKEYQHILFVIAGQAQSGTSADNVILLDYQSDYFHPDLVNAADLVLCKSGYSSIAECYQGSGAVACVSRKVFPESDVLECFVTEEMGGTVIEPDDFLSGRWLNNMEEMLNSKPKEKTVINGAESVADFLLQHL